MIQRARIKQAMDVIEHHGGTDGAHHLRWVIDQVARALKGDNYPAWVERMRAGEDGPTTYDWDEGIAP